MSDMVQLNVGGTVFATSRATLSRYEDSVLGKMFNGTRELTTDPEGRYFIDRDGSLFRYVLNFLRTGRLLIPDEFSELQLLRCEADFYQIPPLVEAVDLWSLTSEQYYLDIAEVNIFYEERIICHKTIVMVGHLDVIKSLPLDRTFCEQILCFEADPDRSPTRRIGRNLLFEIQGHVDGGFHHVFATTLLKSSHRTPMFRFNRSYLAEILLANNCFCVSSSSALKKAHTDDSYEFQCCDRWRIPIESLKLLSDIPKL